MDEIKIKGLEILGKLVKDANLATEEKEAIRFALAYECRNGSLLLPNLD